MLKTIHIVSLSFVYRGAVTMPQLIDWFGLSLFSKLFVERAVAFLYLRCVNSIGVHYNVFEVLGTSYNVDGLKIISNCGLVDNHLLLQIVCCLGLVVLFALLIVLRCCDCILVLMLMV